MYGKYGLQFWVLYARIEILGMVNADCNFGECKYGLQFWVW